MAEAKRGRGRPRGKKSDPEYTTLTTYIKIDTYKALKKRCVDLDMDMSEVVQELLSEWLEPDRRKSKKDSFGGRNSS